MILRLRKSARIVAICLVAILVMQYMPNSLVQRGTKVSAASAPAFNDSQAVVIDISKMPSNKVDYQINITSTGYRFYAGNEQPWRGDYIITGATDSKRTIIVTVESGNPKVKFKNITTHNLYFRTAFTGTTSVFFEGTNTLLGSYGTYCLGCGNGTLKAYAYNSNINVTDKNEYVTLRGNYVNLYGFKGDTNFQTDSVKTVHFEDCDINSVKQNLDTSEGIEIINSRFKADTFYLYTQTCTINKSLVDLVLKTSPRFSGLSTQHLNLTEASIIERDGIKKGIQKFGTENIVRSSMGAIDGTTLNATKASGYDGSTRVVFPMFIKVPGANCDRVKVSVDEWTSPAYLYTDENGYIFPMVSNAVHTVSITTPDGKTYNFKGQPSPDKEVLAPYVDFNKYDQKIDDTLAAQLEQLKIENRNLNTTITSYNQLLSKLRSALAANTNDDLIPKINEANQKLATVQSNLATAQSNVASLQTQLENTIKQLDSQKEATEEAVKEVKALKASQKDLEDQITTLNDQIKKLNATIDEKDKTIASKDTTINGLIAAINVLSTSSGSSSDAAKKANEQLENIRKELGIDGETDIVKAIQNLKDKVTDLETSNKNLVDKKQELDNQLAVEKAQKEELSNVVDEIKGLVNEETTEATLDKIKENEQKIQEQELKIQEMEQTNDDLENQLNEASQKIDDLQAQVDNLTELQDKDLQEQNEELQNQVDNLTQKVDTLTAQNKENEKIIEEQAENMKTVQDTNDKLEKNNEALEAIVERLSGQRDSLKEENESLKKQVEDLLQQVKELKEQNTLLQNLLDEKTKEFDNMKKSISME